MAARQEAERVTGGESFAALRDRLAVSMPEEKAAPDSWDIALSAVEPGRLGRHLLEGGACLFAPAPEPTLRELIDYYAKTQNVSPDDVPLGELKPPPADVWARYLAAEEGGSPQDTSAAPEQRDGCLVLQSMVFPQFLRRALRALAGLGEEQGEACGLHLAMGNLALAGEPEGLPFLLLPVVVARRDDGETALRWSGAAPFVNPEAGRLMGEADEAKLPALVLPPDGPLDLGAFMNAAAEALARNPDLSLTPGLTLTALSFSGAWALRDLFKAGWELGQDAQRSAAAILHAPPKPDASLPESEPGDLDRKLEAPLPFDGPQGRLLEAGASGRSLLAMGVRGTGKTHTAFNLATHALAKGKKVLYVSTRAASLKGFLHHAKDSGIGGAVLGAMGAGPTLATLSAQYREEIKRIAKATQDAHAAEETLAKAREAHEAAGSDLRDYHGALAARIGKLDLKVSAILYETGRLKLEHARLSRVLPEAPGFDATAVDADKRRADKQLLLACEAAVAKVSEKQPLAQHPWAGVSALCLAEEKEREALIQKAQALRDALSALTKSLKRDITAHDKKVLLDDRLLSDLRRLAESRGELTADRERYERALTLVKRVLDGLRIKVANEPAAILAVRRLIEFAAQPPEVFEQVPRSLLTEPDLDMRLEAMEPELSRLAEAQDLLSGTFDLVGLRGLGQERLREMAGILRKRGFFKASDKEWRVARRDLKKIRVLKGKGTDALMPDLLEAAAQFLDDEALFFEESEATHLLGEDLDSAAYWFGAFREGRGWINEVEAAFNSGFARQVQLGPALIALEEEEMTAVAKAAEAEEHEDLVWAAGSLASQDKDWGYAKVTAWAAHLQSLISEENAKLVAGGDGKAKAKDAAKIDLLTVAERLSGEVAAYDQAWQSFKEAAKLRERFWITKAAPDLPARLTRVEHALSDPGSLKEWAGLMTLLNQERRPGVTEIMKAVVAGNVPKAAACDLYDLLLFEALSRAARAAYPALEKHGAEGWQTQRGTYLQSERNLASAIAGALAARLAERALAARKAVETLLGKAASKPVEALFAESFDTLSDVTPCMALTPAAVARLLPAKVGLFDLVILDDAQALYETEASPALLRAKQAVVLADPLRRGVAPGAGLLGTLEGRLPVVQLTGHHGALDFGTAALLSRVGPLAAVDMSVLPRETAAPARFALHAHWRVAGKPATPDTEAQAVAEALAERLRAGLSESVAVVTTGSGQAERIREALDLLFEEEPKLAKSLAGPGEGGAPVVIEPLAVFGDKRRDVILLSPGIGVEDFSPGSLDLLPSLLLGEQGRIDVFCALTPKELAQAVGEDPGGAFLSLVLARAAALGRGDPALPKRELGRLERSLDRALSVQGLQLRPNAFDPLGHCALEESSAPCLPLGLLRLERGEFVKEGALRVREACFDRRCQRLGWADARILADSWAREPQEVLERAVQGIRRDRAK